MTDLLQEKKRALGGWPMVIGWAAMIMFALHASTHMVGAGDTWVAMASGRHFINHGVNTVEPFSANSHRPGPTPEEVKTWPQWAQWITDKVGLDTVKFWHPTGWVNQNWLTHVMFYWLTTMSPFADARDLSFNTLVYWKFAIYILAVICLYYTGRVLGVNPALSAVFACAAVFIGRSFADIRPAGFSNLLVAAFLLVLVLATYRNHLYIWLLVPLTIFWANVHGGYIYVFMMLAPVVILRFLTMLSKRATVSVYSILTWLALYVMMYKDTSHEPFTAVPLGQDKLLVMVVLLSIASIALLLWRSANTPAFYGYHIVTSVLVFLVLFGARFFPENMDMTTPDLLRYVNDSRNSFVTAFAAAVGLGIIVTLLKNRLTVITPRAVWHTAAAGAAAFAASIIFNPFHLTNLTHTFVISISANAEGWRNVHEWWPAFKWDCPVGTAFPFMVMMMAGGGLLAMWLASRLLLPKLVKGPRAELENQQRFFNIAIRVTGFSAAVLICWVLTVSFSLIDVSVPAFLLIGLFVGVLWASVFVNVHYIYIVILLSLFAITTADKGQGYTGRYIFPFITIPAYAALFAVAGQISKKPRFLISSIGFVLVSAIAALILLLVVENPFKFAGNEWVGGVTPGLAFSRLYSLITHPKWLWDLHRLWSPPFEANLEGLADAYIYLFPAIYIINGVCIVSWLLAPVVKQLSGEIGSQPTTTEASTGQSPSMVRPGSPQVNAEQGYQLPRIDLALITISALTVYMAYRSRRFIPIAGYMSCPVIAMLLQQVLEMVSSSWNFHKKGRLKIAEMPRWLQLSLTVTAATVVIGLGTHWGLKFKEIYLDPLPMENKLTSMFMRMTASAVKPFAACDFINANKMSGNMFNYWTEGGFIAWAQQPDPNTGKTPLQLFIDGRAQAAYNYDYYTLWSYIMGGGDIVKLAQMRQKSLTEEDYARIGGWINGLMKQHKAWVILMPTGQFDMPFVKGIERSPDWRMVFLTDKERMYVDITTKRGMEIFNGIEDGSTIYPDDSVRNIMIAHNSLVFGNDPAKLMKGIDCVFKSFEENPTRMPMQLVQYFYESPQFPQLKPKMLELWKRLLDDFTTNEKKYLSSNGYQNRMLGAIVALDYLGQEARNSNNGELLKFYNDQRAKLTRQMENSRNRGW